MQPGLELIADGSISELIDYIYSIPLVSLIYENPKVALAGVGALVLSVGAVYLGILRHKEIQEEQRKRDADKSNQLRAEAAARNHYLDPDKNPL